MVIPPHAWRLVVDISLQCPALARKRRTKRKLNNRFSVVCCLQTCAGTLLVCLVRNGVATLVRNQQSTLTHI